MRIAVLSGGPSGEAGVSRMSGEQVAGALRELGHQAQIVEFGPGALDVLRADPPDLVFPTLHGWLGEDGTAAAMLELLGLRYVGSGVLAGALAMNKAAAKRVWISMGLPTPAFALVGAGSDVEAEAIAAQERLGLPLVCKPNSGGSSLGLTIARDEDAVLDGLRGALALAGPDGVALVEEFREGMEVTVGVLGVGAPVALPPIEITYAAEYDFAAKYTAGASGHVIPARLPADRLREVEGLALAAHHAVAARGLSRVDMICEPSGQTWLLEINTMPGLTALSLFPDAARAAGLSFAQLIGRLVDTAAEL